MKHAREELKETPQEKKKGKGRSRKERLAEARPNAGLSNEVRPSEGQFAETRPVEGRPSKRHFSKGRLVLLVVLVAVCCLMGAALGVAVQYPDQASRFVHEFVLHDASADGAAGTNAGGASEGTGTSADAAGQNGAAGDQTDGAQASDQANSTGAAADGQGAASEADASQPGMATKQVAAYGKVKIYSPIAQKDITGILFHQASYETALVMTTKLDEANAEKISTENPMRVNAKQTDGTWADAEALHLYRSAETTAMDTSLDVGAKAGTTIYAPVTGTVVLVKKYKLYGYVPDVEIHIQPEGHPELDMVMIHQKDAQVKAGDEVVAGTTPVSSVRDIAKDLTDVQLSFYTEGDDPGNHSHIQMNNADAEGYRENSLKGAIKVEE